MRVIVMEMFMWYLVACEQSDHKSLIFKTCGPIFLSDWNYAESNFDLCEDTYLCYRLYTNQYYQIKKQSWIDNPSLLIYSHWKVLFLVKVLTRIITLNAKIAIKSLNFFYVNLWQNVLRSAKVSSLRSLYLYRISDV